MGQQLSIRLAAFLVATSVVPLLAQSPTDQNVLAFEVASIKPNSSDAVGVGGLGWGANNIRGRNQSPASLVRMAFGLQADQIIDTPAWASGERFDINAKVAPGCASCSKIDFGSRSTTKPASSTSTVWCASALIDSGRSSPRRQPTHARRRMIRMPLR